jgi:hypothetical protein
MALREITPKQFQCAAAACPAIYIHEETDKVLVVGEQAELEEFGLDKGSVSQDEVAAILDKEMIQEAISTL